MAFDTNIVIIVLLAVIVLLICWVIYFEIRLRKLLRGRNATNLEDSWNDILLELKDVQSARRDIEAYLRNVEQRLRRSIQGVETIRFNPFKDLNMGSNQSFSTAFLDEDGNGVVVSSLYSRDRVSVYSKPLKNHASEYGLTEEEKDVVTRAKPGKIA
jgi:hypothetical protein